MMKMELIIIDGYNAIHRLPELSSKLKESLREARIALALHVLSWKRRYSNAEVNIVFDGNDSNEFDYPRTSIKGVDCFFANANEGADERIISIVRDSDNPRGIMVISDDNYIRNSSKALGARAERNTFLIR